MEQIDRKVEEILRSPIGCEFLLSVEASGLSPVEAGIPRNSLWLAAGAVDELEWWRGRPCRNRGRCVGTRGAAESLGPHRVGTPGNRLVVRSTGPTAPSLDFPRQGPPGHGQLAASKLPSRPLGAICPKTPYRTVPMHIHPGRRRHVPFCGSGRPRG